MYCQSLRATFLVRSLGPGGGAGEGVYPVVGQFFPVIIRAGDVAVGQFGLVLIEENFDEDVLRVGPLIADGTVEYHLDVTALGDDVVVLPMLMQGVEVIAVVVDIIKFHQASQRQQTRLVAKAQRGAALAAGDSAVALLNHVVQQGTLDKGHPVAVLRRVGPVGVPEDVAQFPQSE